MPHLLTFLTLLVASSATAQTRLYPDPYAQDVANYAFAQYRQAKALSWHQVFEAWFAEGCEVITEQGAKTVTENYVKMFMAENQVEADYDPQLPKLFTDATSGGRVHAKAPGACQYWHSHPELVIKLREDTGWTNPR